MAFSSDHLAMAFSSDPFSFEVVHDMAPREMKGTVYILGKKYDLPKDKELTMEEVRSRIWCTYRKNFRCISGTSLTSDAGWGCTLRCGQMLLAQVLLCKHLGRNFKNPTEHTMDKYNMILQKFLDVRGSEYSIQMIALQGADFGRQVGQWFGPNNVAQAIKKLAAYDSQSRLAVHVCMDMLVVIDDLKVTACEPHGLPDSLVNVTNEKGETIKPDSSLRSRSLTEILPSSLDINLTPPSSTRSSSYCPDSSFVQTSDQGGPRGGMAFPGPIASSSPFKVKTSASIANNTASSIGGTYLDPTLRFSNAKHLIMGDESMDFMKLSLREGTPYTSLSSNTSTNTGLSPLKEEGVSSYKRTYSSPPMNVQKELGEFRSLLIFIPLRLGQDKFNEQYTQSLKDCLTLPQSVGFIGGKPRHALYFIGFNNNDLLYLDPHTTQQTVQPRPDGIVPDSTYHCSTLGHMNVAGLDPSVALGFFCKDEDDLDDLVHRLRQVVLRDNKLNMFDLTEHRPCYWGPMEDSILNTSIREPFLLVDGEVDSDEFEIIEWPPVAIPPIGAASINSD